MLSNITSNPNTSIKQQHLSKLKTQTNKIYTVAAVLATAMGFIYTYYSVKLIIDIIAYRWDKLDPEDK